MNIILTSITVGNYRCFSGIQTAHLAPITLLVGENSSGKTSLLAMIRSLWDVAFANRTPNFKEAPYDLGSFEEVIHRRADIECPATRFQAGFEFELPARHGSRLFGVEATFGSQWGAPALTRRRISTDGYWVEQDLDEAGMYTVRVGSPGGEWKLGERHIRPRFLSEDFDLLPSLGSALSTLRRYSRTDQLHGVEIEPLNDSVELTERDVDNIRRQLSLFSLPYGAFRNVYSDRPFASAPVRSQPRRTHDPERTIQDAEGDYVPSYLAQLSLRQPEAWSKLKKKLEEFGRDAGLFGEIGLLRLGDAESAPFQIQVSRSDRQGRGPKRNLVDVGYGVSQVLPLVTEILRDNGPSIMLLQQPEVHLHPSAQASFGRLLCHTVSGRRRQIIAETHSDFMINRVRMAARETDNILNPEDISIVYMEWTDTGVKLHSMNVDRDGNLLGVPQEYRSFFRNESEWFLGF